MSKKGSIQDLPLWKAILITLAIIVLAVCYIAVTSYLGLNDPWIAFLALTVWGATGMKMKQAPGIFLGGAAGLLISFSLVALPELYGALAVLIPLAAIILSISFKIKEQFPLICNFGLFTFLTIGTAGFISDQKLQLSYMEDLAFGALCFWIIPWSITKLIGNSSHKQAKD